MALASEVGQVEVHMKVVWALCEVQVRPPAGQPPTAASAPLPSTEAPTQDAWPSPSLGPRGQGRLFRTRAMYSLPRSAPRMRRRVATPDGKKRAVLSAGGWALRTNTARL